jgi:hypothetical protein
MFINFNIKSILLDATLICGSLVQWTNSYTTLFLKIYFIQPQFFTSCGFFISIAARGSPAKRRFKRFEDAVCFQILKS